MAFDSSAEPEAASHARHSQRIQDRMLSRFYAALPPLATHWISSPDAIFSACPSRYGNAMAVLVVRALEEI